MIIESNISFTESAVKTRVLRGMVQHASSKKAIADASVLIWNSSIRFKTDTEGKFDIEIPDYIKSTVILIEVRKNGLESSMMSIDLSKPDLFTTIKLEEKIRTDHKSIWSRLFSRRKK